MRNGIAMVLMASVLVGCASSRTGMKDVAQEYPNDQRVNRVEGKDLSIRQPDQKTIVTFTKDGRIVKGDGVTWDDAANAFFEALFRNFPTFKGMACQNPKTNE